jgi:hypothetical protein
MHRMQRTISRATASPKGQLHLPQLPGLIVAMPDGHWILGDLFEQDYDHSVSTKKLWDMRWKLPCQRGVYPFHDGNFDDFAPIFERLITNDINDQYEDAYTNAFLPTGRRLAKQASEAEANY